ncbi:SDR family oxidoreductase [Rhizobacter sp. LjRoot28]|uniref:SDR family oxidoreductase n=1 Tax=Rhizobacter sp. LjRoot28 TaxID=3342309 RepID=UPI003F502C19
MDSKDDRSPSATRRNAIGLLGAGLATAPAWVGSAQAQTEMGAARHGGGRPRPPLADPRNLYPKPPFPVQQQPWPGLASRMTPVPDHGERSYVGSGRLAGRKALITGGDSGIGRAAAIAYAREGADVAIGYLPAEEEDAREVLRLIRAEGRRAVALPGDIRDEGFCMQFVQRAVSGLGGLDILVNNAARQRAQKSIADITTEQFDATLKTNLYAMFWITKAALPHLPAGAAIINTASVVAYQPPAELLDYSTTKAGIVAFTKSLAKQLAEKGIRVNAVAPGPFWTPLQPSGGQLPEDLPTFGADTPYGRPGQPAEIAPLFVTLASTESSYASGEVFSSTGGRSGP